MSAQPVPVEEVLLRQVESFPTTNVTRIFRHAGKRLPETIGGGCLWMAAQLAKALRVHKPGIAISHYHLGEPGSHTTTVSDDGMDRKLYEPWSFQVRPFSLTHFAKDERCCTSDTYPPKGGKLRFTWATPTRLRMELISPRGNPLRTFEYLFDTAVTLNEEDPYGGLPLPDRQEQMYFHLLNADASKTVLMMGIQTRRLNVGRAWDNLYGESEPGFNSRFEAVAERLQVTGKELRDLLVEACDIHDALFPGP